MAYLSLHLTTVINAAGCGVSWMVLRDGINTYLSFHLTGVFNAAGCGVSWMVLRVGINTYLSFHLTGVFDTAEDIVELGTDKVCLAGLSQNNTQALEQDVLKHRVINILH